MSQMIRVEEYSNTYQAQIVDLILHIQQDEYQIPITQADQPDLLEVGNFYQKGYGNFWVALDTDKVVGTIALLDIGDRYLALRKMFVAKEYRGQVYKAAHKLLSTALAWSVTKGIQEIYLGTTRQFLAAHRFYEKNGFQEIPSGELPSVFPVMAVDKKFYKYTIG